MQAGLSYRYEGSVGGCVYSTTLLQAVNVANVIAIPNAGPFVAGLWLLLIAAGLRTIRRREGHRLSGGPTQPSVLLRPPHPTRSPFE